MSDCEHDHWTSHHTMTSTHIEYTCTDCDFQWQERITYHWCCPQCGEYGDMADGPELAAIQAKHDHVNLDRALATILGYLEAR